MQILTHLLGPTWHRRPQSTAEAIRLAEMQLGVTLPQDYKVFLAWSDGGEGHVGRRYLSLWPVERLAQLNHDYAISQYLPGVVAIGSDGGDNSVALDYRTSNRMPALVEVPFGDLTTDAIASLGESFAEGVTLLLEPSMIIELSEPWSLAGAQIQGRIVGRLTGADGKDYWLVQVADANGVDLAESYLVISSRYDQHLLADLAVGKLVIVGIAKALDPHLAHQHVFNFDQVDYFAIGSAVLAQAGTAQQDASR